jgi:glycosyltransferase involved in cell wall biosynthesis
MLTTTKDPSGSVDLLERQIPATEARDLPGREALPGRGVYGELDGRLLPILPGLPSLEGMEPARDGQPVLAVFCYEDPGSAVGGFVGRLAGALARRQVAVHVFSRRDFDLEATGVSCHVLGECPGEDLLGQVQEFTRRACNAFLKQFQGGTAHVTLLGHEWASVPALSLLRGIKDANVLLSLHSLERQRSDLANDLSRQIAEIELGGLREARTLLFHEAGTAEAARLWLPECAPRGVLVRQPFPVSPPEGRLDPGQVKARYQVGPVDPTILYIGDLSERYGPDLLVKAMPAILKNHKHAHLIVAGDGPLFWPLRVYARYLLLESRVRLPGSVEGQALRELIAAADLVVVPSREATPWWPILAAWAADRPVAATHDAAAGLVEHEGNAVLFYPNENSCVWGVERLLFDADLGRQLAQAGAHKLEERFGWNSVAMHIEELMGVRQAR